MTVGGFVQPCPGPTVTTVRHEHNDSDREGGQVAELPRRLPPRDQLWPAVSRIEACRVLRYCYPVAALMRVPLLGSVPVCARVDAVCTLPLCSDCPSLP